MRRLRKQAGLTLIELIVAFSIMLILSTIALPLARVKVHREKERQLRHGLAEVRKAIDRYKDMADQGQLGPVEPDTFGYPPSLEILVEGVPVQMGAMGGGLGAQGQPGFGTPAGQLGNRGGGSFGGGGMGGSSFGSRQGGSFGGGSMGGRGGSAFGGGGLGGSSGGQRGGGFGGQRGGAFGGRQGGGFGNRQGGGFGSGSGSFGSQGMESDDSERKIRFLRKIPWDPMTNSADWGIRGVEDDPNSFNWGGRNVFDVFTKSMDTALDGTRYSEW